MINTQNEIHPFIAYLQKLAERQDRGALAALRRGLGQPPGTVAETYRYIVPWLGEDMPRSQQAVYYLVASLFALHPSTTDTGNMGQHLARTGEYPPPEALERRFTALLAAHVDDLPFYLRQAVSYLKSKDMAVNWNQLLRDLQRWDHPDRIVQRQWAASFWRAPKNDPTV